MVGRIGAHDRALTNLQGVVQLAAKALAEMTDEQLESEWTKAANQLEELKERLREFSQEHQFRAAEARAAQLAESLSDDEKRALLQTMEAEGVASEEAVNG
jgi:hypothetical protein